MFWVFLTVDDVFYSRFIDRFISPELSVASSFELQTTKIKCLFVQTYILRCVEKEKLSSSILRWNPSPSVKPSTYLSRLVFGRKAPTRHLRLHIILTGEKKNPETSNLLHSRPKIWGSTFSRPHPINAGVMGQNGLTWSGVSRASITSIAASSSL